MIGEVRYDAEIGDYVADGATCVCDCGATAVRAKRKVTK